MLFVTWPWRLLEVLLIGSDVDVDVVGVDTRVMAMISMDATAAMVSPLFAKTLAYM